MLNKVCNAVAFYYRKVFALNNGVEIRKILVSFTPFQPLRLLLVFLLLQSEIVLSSIPPLSSCAKAPKYGFCRRCIFPTFSLTNQRYPP